MGKELKKVPVLLVVGTGDETVNGFDVRPGEEEYMKNRYRWRAGFLMESEEDRKNLKKAIEKKECSEEFKKDPLKLHYKGVEEAIRIAQEKGYVVYSTEKLDTPFYKSIKYRGKRKTGIDIKKIIFSGGFAYFDAIKFYDNLEEKNVIPTVIIACGHWRDGCVSLDWKKILDYSLMLKVLRYIKEQPKICFLIGTPSIVSYKGRPFKNKKRWKMISKNTKRYTEFKEADSITLLDFKKFRPAELQKKRTKKQKTSDM